MKSYFFIPGNKKEFLNKINKIDSDFFIIDLEDAINENDIDISVKNINQIKNIGNYYIRIPFKFSGNKFQYFDLINDLLKLGVRKFVIPKFVSLDQLLSITNFVEEKLKNNLPHFLLLIENPRALLQLDAFLQLKNVKGVALGSHDFCSVMKMNHSFKNIYWARMYLLTMAKAHQKNAIDIASMDIKNEKQFLDECQQAFESGFDGKFVIHPNQLRIMKNMECYSELELQKALKIKAHMDSIGGVNNFTIFKLDGQVIEKPHLDKYRNILEKNNYESF